VRGRRRDRDRQIRSDWGSRVRHRFDPHGQSPLSLGEETPGSLALSLERDSRGERLSASGASERGVGLLGTPHPLPYGSRDKRIRRPSHRREVGGESPHNLGPRGKEHLTCTLPASHGGARLDMLPSKDVVFVPVLTASLPSPACHGRRLPGPLRQATPFAPPPTGDLPPQAFGLRRPRALPSSFRLVISERASHEVPGFGAPVLPPALASKPLRLPWVIAVDHGLSASGQRWRSGLRRRWQSGRRAKCESRPSPPIQRQAKGRTLSPRRGVSLGIQWGVRVRGHRQSICPSRQAWTFPETPTGPSWLPSPWRHREPDPGLVGHAARVRWRCGVVDLTVSDLESAFRAEDTVPESRKLHEPAS
jgi:hypothetical protein